MNDFNFDELVQSMKEAIDIERELKNHPENLHIHLWMLKQYEKKLTNPKLSFPIC